MIKAMKSLLNDKRGNVFVMVGFSMPVLIGMAGLATDTIQWNLWNRQLQRAADSAAIAGVYAQQGGETAANGVTRDLIHTQNTGFTLLGTPNVTTPTVTGFNFVTRVELELQRKLSFSSFFMTSVPVIRAAATAGAAPGGDYCIVSLETGATNGIYATGNTDLDLGCGMITNATDLNEAAFATGSARVNASPIAAAGGINTSSSNWVNNPTFIPYASPMPDPFANVNPTPPSTCSGGNVKVAPKKNKTATLSPGCYTSLEFAGQGSTTLDPGVYFISGGDLDFGSQATVDATAGVTFVLTNVDTATNATIGSVDMKGGSEVSIVSPKTGNTAGIAIYQDRRAVDTGSGGSANSPNKLNGGSGSKLEGAMYFPNQQITWNGNSSADVKCMQLVARRVYFSGTSDITNVCPPGSAASSFSAPDGGVRLIA